MNGDKSKKRTKSQKSKEPKKAKTDDEMVTVEVVESSELNEAMNHIFFLAGQWKEYRGEIVAVHGENWRPGGVLERRG